MFSWLISKVPWSSVARVAAGVLVIAAIGIYILWLHLKIANLQTTVASQNGTISVLHNSIDHQNAAIQQWKSVANTRQQAAQKAIARAQAASRSADKRISELQASKAKSCEQGVQLINEALGL